MTDHMHDDGATAALHSIEAGGQHLLMLTRRRIAECLDEMDKGDFREAHSTAQSIVASLSPLAHAQAYIGVAHGSKLVPARELKVGDVLTDVGEITEVEVTECPAERCQGHVKFKIGDHEVGYDGNVELYINDRAEIEN